MTTPYYTHWHPTQYLGITFRSKLEARWYAFFAHLGLSVSYEPRQFAIPELITTPEYHYTPDFGLLGMPYPVIEIKPNLNKTGGVVNQAILKLKAVSREVPCALIAGSCWPGEFDIAFFRDGEVFKPKMDTINKVRLVFGLARKESKSVVALKMLLNNHKGDYMGAFRYSYEVVK